MVSIDSEHANRVPHCSLADAIDSGLCIVNFRRKGFVRDWGPDSSQIAGEKGIGIEGDRIQWITAGTKSLIAEVD
jgi:hypothetical protein